MEGENKQEPEKEAQEEQDKGENEPKPEQNPEESPSTEPPPEPEPEPQPEPEIVKQPSVVKSKSRSVASETKSPIRSPTVKGSLSEKKTSVPSVNPAENAGSPKASPRRAASVAVEEEERNQDIEVVSRPSSGLNKGSIGASRVVSVTSGGGGGATGGGSIHHSGSLPGGGNFPCSGGLLQKRSPFIHNPPQPEERRARIQCPRTPREYIINLREDLADFQEAHGLPRTRDYSFVSLGLALAQETGRAIYSVFLMFTELFPILAIVSLILRFALDKLIEILETTETVPKVKKSIIFALEMLAIMIPLWILIGTIIIPLVSLILSIFKKMLRIKGSGGKKKVVVKQKVKPKPEVCFDLF